MWYYYLGTECQHRPELSAFRTISPKTQNKSLKHSTNLHRTLHVPPITTIISIQNAQKTAEALNGTAKTDPKNRLKSPQNRSKVSKASKIK